MIGYGYCLRLALAVFTLTVLQFIYASTTDARNITKTRLDNGLTVILDEDKSAPVTAFQMWVKVGAADESDSESGIAHVFEHMLFKGTKKRGVGELAAVVESAGGEINAYTSFDNTVYHLALPSRNFDAGLDVISDAIQNSSFDPVELKKELEVVMEEIRMNEDSPGRKLYKILLSASYAAHPYGRPVIGTEKTVGSFTRPQILKFFKKWYRPDNMTLVVAGDFDTKAALTKIKTSFRDFKPGIKAARSRAKEPEQKGLRIKTAYQPINDTHLALSFHIPELSHSDIYAIDILQEILSSGVTSRLYKSLKVDATLVHAVSSYSMTPKDPGLFIINMTLDSANSDAAIKTALNEVSRLKAEDVSERELEKAKRSLESSFIYERETMEGKAQQLGYYETISGDVKFEEKYLEGIKSVTKDDIRRVVKLYLTVANMTVSAVAPSKENETFNEEALLKTITDSALNAPLTVVAPTASKSAVAKEVLPNGITLLIKEDHSNETVAVYAAFPGGVLHETPENNGIGSFMASALSRGTKTRTFEKIGEELEDIAGGVGGFSSKNSSGVSGKFLSRYFDKGFDVFADVLLNPVFPDEELEKIRKDVLASIKRDEDYLPGYTFKLLYKDLYGSHPYSMPVKGTIESVKSIDRSSIIKHYNSIFRPEKMVIAVVGDIDAAKVRSAVIKYFGGFKSSDKARTLALSTPSLASVKATGAKKDKEQTNIGLGFLSPGFGTPDSYALTVMSEAIGSQSGRLFVELRDKMSLAYSVSAFYVPGAGTGVFGIYIGCAPQKSDNAVTAIRSELANLREKGITEEELYRAKRAIIGQYEMGLQNVSSQASDMATNELLGFGYDYNEKYPGLIEGIGAADVLNAANKYITLDSYVISTVGPSASEEKPR